MFTNLVIMTQKEEKVGLSLINSHAGKRRVYETYKRTNPDMAQKYLEFVAKNQSIHYIKWDDHKKKFKA
jgi:hypothetical protein